MSSKYISYLSDKFSLQLNKLAQDQKAALSEKLQKIVQDLSPFVMDNLLEEHPSHYEITIDVSNSPHYTSERQNLSDEEMFKLVKYTANILKNNFDVVDVSFKKDKSEDAKIISVMAKIRK